jgi:hypothetical protein
MPNDFGGEQAQCSYRPLKPNLKEIILGPQLCITDPKTGVLM